MAKKEPAVDLFAEQRPAPSQIPPDVTAKYAHVGTKPNDPHRNDPHKKPRRRDGMHRGVTVKR